MSREKSEVSRSLTLTLSRAGGEGTGAGPLTLTLSRAAGEGTGAGLPTLLSSSVCINVEISEGAFDQALAKRLRQELDALDVAAPAPRPQPLRAMRLALGSMAAMAVGAALLLGTVAVFASGSPDPRVWLRAAQHSLGVPLVGEHSPLAVQSSPESAPEPESFAPAATAERESPNPAEVERESPQPARPEAPQPADPIESTSASPGDG